MTRVLIAHIGGRIRAFASTPSSIAILLLCALISAFFWPSLTPAGTAPWGLDAGTPGPHRRVDDPSAMIALVVTSILWIGFFPHLLGMIIRPPVTGKARSCAIETGHPALPIPLRARILAEAVTVLVLILVARVPFVLWRNAIVGGAAQYPPNIAGPFLLGALILTPGLFLVLGRARSLERLFGTTTVIAVVVFATMPLGLLATSSVLTMTLLPIAAFTLWFGGTVQPRRTFSFGFLRPTRLSRPAIDPELRLRLDFATKPLVTLLPFAVFELAFMVLLSKGLIGGLVFYFGSTFVYSLLIAYLVLRPMGSGQVIGGVWGKTGFEPGDFARAYSVLPVRRELVLRTVWLHGFVTGSLLWLAVVLTGAFNARIALGEALFFTDSDGRFIGEIVFPLLAMIPCGAAFLVEGAAGDKRMAFVAGALFVLAPQIMFVMLITGASPVSTTFMMFLIAIAGGLPAFRHFRSEPVAD